MKAPKCFCDAPMQFQGNGMYPYECISKDKHPNAAIYRAVACGHGCWDTGELEGKPIGEAYNDDLYYCGDCGQPCEVAIAQFVRHHPWGDEPYEAPASACCHGEYQQGCALNFFDKQRERDRLEREGTKSQ
jgi:hypothetical protein